MLRRCWHHSVWTARCLRPIDGRRLLSASALVALALMAQASEEQVPGNQWAKQGSGEKQFLGSSWKATDKKSSQVPGSQWETSPKVPEQFPGSTWESF